MVDTFQYRWSEVGICVESFAFSIQRSEGSTIAESDTKARGGGGGDESDAAVMHCRDIVFVVRFMAVSKIFAKIAHSWLGHANKAVTRRI